MLLLQFLLLVSEHKIDASLYRSNRKSRTGGSRWVGVPMFSTQSSPTLGTTGKKPSQQNPYVAVFICCNVS